MYRVYRYANNEKPYRHLLLLRERSKGLVTERREPQEHEHRLDESLSRTRRNIKDTILCNNFTLFCTFTFSKDKVPDRSNFSQLRKLLSQHFNNYQKRVDANFKYFFVPERHKNGAIHFHGCCTFIRDLDCPELIFKRVSNDEIKLVPNTKKYLNWPYYSDRFGFFSCSHIIHHGKCANYITKYITKDLFDWVGKGKRVLFKSHGLKKPELVYDGDDYNLYLKPDDCDSEYCKAAWATEEQTALFYRHWSYPHESSIIQPEDWWKHEQWPKYRDKDGCSNMTYEQLTFLQKRGQF